MIKHVAKKPLWGTRIYIREETLRKAFHSGGKLEVEIPGKGTAVVDAKGWKMGEYAPDKQPLKMEKVFLRPDEPMVLYGGDLPIKSEAPAEPIIRKEDPQQKLL